MSGTRVVRFFLCLTLLLAVLAGLAGNHVALAQEEKIELTSKYPVLRGESGDSYEFEVAVSYQSSEPKIFDLAATVPQGWTVVITGGYEAKQISAIRLEPGMAYPETVKLNVRSPLGANPDPGEYLVKMEASSGELKDSVELKAVITARYGFFFYSASGMYNTEVTSGKDNHFPVLLENTGTAPVTNIMTRSSKPEGWNITFNPSKIDSLATGTTQEIDVVITPPEKTIAGDYLVILTASSDKESKDAQIRITVETPTVWGWIGVLIVLAVIAGLGILFWRLGRR